MCGEVGSPTHRNWVQSPANHIFFILLFMGTSLDSYLGYLNNAKEREGADIFSD